MATTGALVCVTLHFTDISCSCSLSFCLQKAEAETLLEMLPRYYQYMTKHSRRSLLTRFCGMYQVRLGDAAADGHHPATSSAK